MSRDTARQGAVAMTINQFEIHSLGRQTYLDFYSKSQLPLPSDKEPRHVWPSPTEDITRQASYIAGDIDPLKARRMARKPI